MLGSTILIHTGSGMTSKAALKIFENVQEEIGGSLSKGNQDMYDSTTNILWNAVLVAGVYTPFFATEQFLKCDALLSLPVASSMSHFDKDQMIPFAVAAAITRHYAKHIRAQEK